MMPERPRSDRDLDEEIVRKALLEEFPDVEARSVEPLGSGWATDVYLVDGRLVLRFPRNAEIARWLDSDEAILRLVERAIGSILKVPRVLLRGRGGVYFPHGFLGCELVPGVGADDPRAPPSDRLVGDLGRTLTHVHSVPVEAARAIGLSRPDFDPYAGPPRFLHGDFSPDNVIVDPSSGRLAGVIDWGNAAVGDPALDFMGLVLWRGWGFARRVLDAYGGGPVDEDFVERVRFHAETQAVQWLADTVRRRGDSELHLTWVRNAFGSC